MNASSCAKGTSLGKMQLNFPTLPHTFLHAMELSRHVGDVSIEEVVQVIQNDPSAVTRILRVVNSAYHGMRSEVNSIHQAVIILGPEAVLGIVMSMSLIDLRASLNVTTTAPFLNLVRHSIATGFLARHIFAISSEYKGDNQAGRNQQNEAFTTGLLHDFGKIVLLHNFPDQAADLYGNLMPEDIDDEEALNVERNVFGFNHAETGGYLMKLLKFPATIAAIVERHHSNSTSDQLPPELRGLLHIVVVSNCLANTLGYGFNHQYSLDKFKTDDVLDQILDTQLIPVNSKEELIDKFMGCRDVLDAYVNDVT